MLNLGKAGIDTVCYNFMPVLDWTRTDLDYPLADGSTALRFDATEFAAFEIFILKRKGAEESYTESQLQKAHTWYNQASEAAKTKLIRNIIAGLPKLLYMMAIQDLNLSRRKWNFFMVQ